MFVEGGKEGMEKRRRERRCGVPERERRLVFTDRLSGGAGPTVSTQSDGPQMTETRRAPFLFATMFSVQDNDLQPREQRGCGPRA